jgi:aspartyl-tRNA(Asn)/glutamyl-tRNA(Gln) amidotransferase subunit B
LGQLALRKKSFYANPVSLEQMGGLIDMVQNGIVTGTVTIYDPSFLLASDKDVGSSGKLLLRHMLDHPSSKAPMELAEHLGLLAVQGDDFLEQLCVQAITDMPEEADAVRRGVPNVINKLLGRVMRSSRGTVDPQSIRRMLQTLLCPP